MAVGVPGGAGDPVEFAGQRAERRIGEAAQEAGAECRLVQAWAWHPLSD